MKKRKVILERQLARKTAKRDELKKRAMESESVEEVRAINDQLMELADDIRDITDELADIDERMRGIVEGMDDGNGGSEGDEGEGRACGDDEEDNKRSQPPVGATKVNGNIRNGKVVGSFDMRGNDEVTEPTGTKEYRTAFMNYVQRGTPIPAELRAGGTITSDDTGAAIPITIMREIINKVRVRYGNLYSKVRKLAVQGGVEIPIGEMEASFSWVTEDTVSPDKDLGKLGSVSFKYYTAELRIAQSFLQAVVTMDIFEEKLAEIIAIAYMKAMDIGIVRGTGNGQMTGIIIDVNVTGNSTNIITMNQSQMGDWTKWVSRVFASIVPGYRGGEFIMSYATVDKYLRTMHDDNNRPLYYDAAGLVVNDMDERRPSARFYGHDVALVENTVLPDFDTASSGDVVAIYWIPEESYGINENFGFTMRRYFDETTNKWITKALTVVDGKPINPASIYLIKKA